MAFLLIVVVFVFAVIKLCSNRKHKYFDQIDYSKVTVIPKKIFMTWHTKDLPGGMKQNTDLIKQLNPEFEVHIYDTEECRTFLRDNYDVNILNAYDTLQPKAYKADLWRLCVLYKLGGIYLDVKIQPLNGFKFYSLLYDEHFASDVDAISIYNAIMVCKPGNTFLFDAIHRIVKNVEKQYYGFSPLDITGPVMLGKVKAKKKHILNVDLQNKSFFDRNIYYQDKAICKISYSLLYYFMPQKQGYGSMWWGRKVYDAKTAL